MHELRRIDNLILKCKLASAKTISIKLKTATIDDRCETSKKKKISLISHPVFSSVGETYTAHVFILFPFFILKKNQISLKFFPSWCMSFYSALLNNVLL